jgi:hypothetical protein
MSIDTDESILGLNIMMTVDIGESVLGTCAWRVKWWVWTLMNQF